MPTDEEYNEIIFEGRPNDKEEVIDMYISMNLIFDVRTNDESYGTAVKRWRGINGREIVRSHINPLFDTREYKTEKTYGTRDNYNANIITQNFYAQVDYKGHQLQLLAEIQDH